MPNKTAFAATDRLFVIGNGVDIDNRSNALIMLKNGNTQLNGVLSLSNGMDTLNLPNTKGTNGQVLTSDGVGNAAWMNAAPIGAEQNVQSDWNATTGDAQILNKPTTISTTQASAITANTAKVGITATQASAITANTAKVSADGLVTTHSDVTDAGSGKIITAAERTILNAALQAETQDLAAVLGQGTDANAKGITNLLSINSTNGAKLTESGIWMNASDRNKKTNIAAMEYGLEEILALQPVSYDYKKGGSRSLGFIAQEVEKVLPELVAGKEGDKALAYSLLTSVLVKAMQEMDAEHDDLEAKVADLEAENAKLKAMQGQMQRMEKMMAQLLKDNSEAGATDSEKK